MGVPAGDNVALRLKFQGEAGTGSSGRRAQRQKPKYGNVFQ